MREQTEYSFHRNVADIQRNTDRKCFAIVEWRLGVFGRMVVVVRHTGGLFLKQDYQNTEQAENPAHNYRLVLIDYLEVQALRSKKR